MVKTKYESPKVVAEIGAVHLGSLDRAKELTKLAKLCGADYMKTQKRNPDESTPEHMKNLPHPNEIFSYGKTYLEHRKNLELTIQEHAELKTYCEEIGIGYSASVWDMTSAREIVALAPDFIKVPSACNCNKELLDFLKDNYQGEIHISTGMTTKDEMRDLAYWIINDKVKNRIVLYHCTSKYPCGFEDLHLLEINRLSHRYNNSSIRIGFSNHGKGIAADVAAYVMGAEWIERHFVDDRMLRHTDASASLEPAGLSKLCRDLSNIHSALQYRPEQMDDEELVQRNKLKSTRSLSSDRHTAKT